MAAIIVHEKAGGVRDWLAGRWELVRPQALFAEQFIDWLGRDGCRERLTNVAAALRAIVVGFMFPLPYGESVIRP